MSNEHRRPLLAFVAVFVVAVLVVVAAARSDALRHLVHERTVDIVAGTTLDVVGAPEQRRVVAAPEVASGNEPVSSPAKSGPAQGTARKGRAAQPGQPAATGRARSHAHAKAPGRARGHAHAAPQGKANAHAPKGHAHGKGHAQGKRHAHGRGRGHGQHGH